MIDTRYGLLPTIQYCDGTHIVYTTESTVEVEVCVESNHLVVGRAADVLYTRLLILRVMIVQGNDDILTIVLSPSRLVSSILVVEGGRVAGSIVDSDLCMEAQTLQQCSKVNIHTSVELELTTGPRVVTCRIHISDHVGPVCLCSTTTQETTIDDVIGCSNHSQGSSSVLIQITQRNQRTDTVRTHGGSLLPEISTIGTAGVVVSGIGIHESINEAVDLHIHITTDVETVNEVILCLTEVTEVTLTIVADVGIEFSALVTTLYLCRDIGTVIGLLDKLRRVEVHIRITIGIIT